MRQIDQQRLLKRRDKLERRKRAGRLKARQRARWSVFMDVKRMKYPQGAYFPGILRSFLQSDKAMCL